LQTNKIEFVAKNYVKLISHFFQANKMQHLDLNNLHCSFYLFIYLLNLNLHAFKN